MILQHTELSLHFLPMGQFWFPLTIHSLVPVSRHHRSYVELSLDFINKIKLILIFILGCVKDEEQEPDKVTDYLARRVEGES